MEIDTHFPTAIHQHNGLVAHKESSASASLPYSRKPPLITMRDDFIQVRTVWTSTLVSSPGKEYMYMYMYIVST